MNKKRPFAAWKSARLEAFTLTEVVTVMIITGILLTIVYGSFRAVEQRYQVFARSARIQTEVSLLNTLLQKDIEKAWLVQGSPQRLTIRFAATQALPVEYHFLEASIVRTQQSVSDTFHLVPDSVAFRWRQNLQTQADSPIDNVFFLGRVQGERYVFHCFKEYDYQTRWWLEQDSLARLN